MATTVTPNIGSGCTISYNSGHNTLFLSNTALLFDFQLQDATVISGVNSPTSYNNTFVGWGAIGAGYICDTYPHSIASPPTISQSTDSSHMVDAVKNWVTSEHVSKTLYSNLNFSWDLTRITANNATVITTPWSCERSSSADRGEGMPLSTLDRLVYLILCLHHIILQLGEYVLLLMQQVLQ